MVNSLLGLDASLVEAMLEALPVGICVTDREGKFVAVNRAYSEIYGYQPSEMLGQSFLMVVREEDRELMKRLHDDFIAGKAELEADWTVQGKGGRLIEIVASARRFLGRDGCPYKLTLVQDVTLKRSLERFRAFSERMMFQEIMRPLETLKNLVEEFDWELLRQRASSIDYEAECRQTLETIDLRLGGLRALSDIVSGIFQSRPTEVELSVLFEKLGKLYDYLAKIKGLGLRFEQRRYGRPLDGAGYILRVDYKLLRNTLENLVKNAIEASPHGEWISILADLQLDRFLITVENRGEVPSEILERFFQPYVTTKSGGTGLGTYSARLMTEAMGGAIRVQSRGGIISVSIALPVNVVVRDPGR